jgi:ribonuclease-3
MNNDSEINYAKKLLNGSKELTDNIREMREGFNFDKARDFIYRFILSDLENKQLFFDSKSNLQEYVAKNLKKEVEYKTVEETGEGNDKFFRSAVYVDGEVVAEGSGRSKKASQQEAAYNALIKIRSTDVS